MKKYFLHALLLGALLLLTACTSDRVYLEQDQSLGWYPSRVENELAGEDPLEGFNRTMFTVNDFCMELPRYQRPKKIIFAQVPRNPTGKIEKPKLRKLYGADQLVAQQNELR